MYSCKVKKTGSSSVTLGKGKIILSRETNILPAVNQSERRKLRFGDCFRNRLCRANFVYLCFFALESLLGFNAREK